MGLLRMDCATECFGHNLVCIPQFPSNALLHLESLQNNVPCFMYIRSRNTFRHYIRAMWHERMECDIGFETFRQALYEPV